MSVTGAQLLKLLGAGIRPVDSDPLRAGAGPVESLSFAALLSRVGRGEVSSGVRVHEGAHVHGMFDADQIGRLSQAADAAEAAGVTRLVAVIDGYAATIDIARRQIIDAEPVAQDSYEGARHAIRADIDGFVIVPTEGGVTGVQDVRPEASRATHGGAPGLPTRNPRVAELLAGIESGAIARRTR